MIYININFELAKQKIHTTNIRLNFGSNKFLFFLVSNADHQKHLFPNMFKAPLKHLGAKDSGRLAADEVSISSRS